MIVPIVAYGMPVLRKKCSPVPGLSPALAELIQNLWHTLENAGGVGLAAPQVNADANVFVVNNLKAYEDNGRMETSEEEKGIRKVFINPEIISYSSDTWRDEEGCLSIPGLSAYIDRSSEITIRFQDEFFQPHTETYRGHTARVIQHEYDHILGKLYLDHVGPLRKRLLNNRLEKIRKGQVKVEYPVIFA